MRSWFRIAVLVGLSLVSAGGEARAISLALTTTTPSVNPADPVVVKVEISGLGNFASPSLGVFDFDVSFNPLVLSFVGVSFGTQLGVPGLTATVVSGSLGGTVDLAESSLLSAATLVASQPGSFVLATITFSALAPGVSPLAFTQTVLGDENGLPLSSSSTGLSILVTPEPASAVLLAGGLVGLAASCGSRRRS